MNELQPLPKNYFKYATGSEQIHKESNENWGLDKVTVEYDPDLPEKNGVFTYIMGAQFPLKNFPYKNHDKQFTIVAVNIAKAILIESIKIFSKWYFIFLFPFIYGNKQGIIDGLNRMLFRIVGQHILVEEARSEFARSFGKVIFIFLIESGFSEKSSEQFAEIFSSMLDADNAYRIRLEDIFSEMKIENINMDMRKEIKRLMRIFTDRQSKDGVSDKFQKIVNIISFVLIVPRLKNALIKALNSIDLRMIGYVDDAEKYWVCIRTDYKFMGMTLEERQDYAKMRGWKMPEQLK